MTATIIDLAAVRNARRPQPEPAAPEPTQEQRAAQDWLDMWVPVGSLPMKRSRKRRPTSISAPTLCAPSGPGKERNHE
jgi:hypothetical protein